MTPDLWAAFALFAFVSAVTPGPNNTLLMASGLNFGLRRSLPFLAGVQVGFSLMLLVSGLGIGQALLAVPEAETAMRIGGAAYLAWFAWRLARTDTRPEAGEPRVFGFFKGAAFQAVNPKAWVVSVTAVTVYVPVTAGLDALLLAVLTALAFGVPSNLIWVLGGRAAARLVASPARRRTINVALAVLLLISIVPVFLT